MTVQTFAQMVPCVGREGHNFQMSYPPAGQFGNALACCTRCGMTPEQAKWRPGA